MPSPLFSVRFEFSNFSVSLLQILHQAFTTLSRCKDWYIISAVSLRFDPPPCPLTR